MWKIKSLRAWLNVGRFYDGLFAMASGGFAALREVLREIKTYWRSEKPDWAKSFLPSFEPLEVRELMTGGRPGNLFDPRRADVAGFGCRRRPCKRHGPQ
jgi:hypothetical protein